MRYFIAIIFSIFLIMPVFADDVEHYHYHIKAGIEKNTISKNVFVYNLSNAKLHLPDCEWAEKCTRNCIYISKKDLKKMFFVPCMVCGGGVIEPMDEFE